MAESSSRQPVSAAAGAAPLERVAGRVAMLSGGTTLSHALLLLASPVLTRLFTPASFAVFGFHQAALALLALVLTLQYETAIPIPRESSDANLLLRLALRTAAVLTALASVLVLFVALSPSGSAWWLPVSVMLLLPFCSYGEAVARAYRLDFVRDGRFREMTLARLLQAVATVLGQVACGLAGLVTIGLPVGDALGRWISAGFFALRGRGRRDVPVRPSTGQLWKIARRFSRFPLYMTPAAMLALLVNVCPALVLPGLYGEDFAGQFALANRSILLPLLIISQAVTHVYIADASRLIRERDPRLVPLIRRTVLQMGGVGLGLSLIAAISGPWLFPLVFGAEWAPAGEIVPLLAIGGFAQFVGGPVSQILILLRKESRLLMMHLVGVVAVLAALWGSARWGLSAPQATLIYALSILGIQLMYLWQSLAASRRRAAAWSDEQRPAELPIAA